MRVVNARARALSSGMCALLVACGGAPRAGASSAASGSSQIEFHPAGSEPRRSVVAAAAEPPLPPPPSAPAAAERAAVGRARPSVSVPSGTPPPAALQVTDLVVGTGREAVPGTRPEVHYVGVAWSTGAVFDASWDRGQPFSFALGQHQVIAGWEQGLAGMREGGRRRIVIPPALGYGARGAGGAIGPNETLVFAVDLLVVH